MDQEELRQKGKAHTATLIVSHWRQGAVGSVRVGCVLGSALQSATVPVLRSLFLQRLAMPLFSKLTAERPATRSQDSASTKRAATRTRGQSVAATSPTPTRRTTRSSVRAPPEANILPSKRTRVDPAAQESSERPRKRPSLKQAAVPAPDVDRLPPLVGTKDEHRSPEAQLKRSATRSEHNALRWYKTCPVFINRSVTAKQLQGRDKKSAKEKAKAEAIVESMKSWKADAGSLAIVDRDGEVIFVYCGVAFEEPHLPTLADFLDGRIKLKDLPPYPGSEGRTEDDVTAHMNHDGLQEANLERTHVGMQNVFHVTPPVASAADQRHPDDNMMAYATNLQQRNEDVGVMAEDEEHTDGDDEDDVVDGDSNGRVTADAVGEGHVREGVARGDVDAKDIAYERCGVHHFVHGWTMKGHPDGPLYPSRDMGRSSLGYLATCNYYLASRPTILEVNDRFKLAFPKFFAQYKQAFEAGVVNLFDDGPFLGRALVWKMQVRVHRDGLDQGPAAIFPCGYYTGGYLYIPDLKLKLAYRPRDLAIFLAGHLYHALDEWKPSAAPAKKGVTPGRASTVLFFPANSYERLKDKPKFWSCSVRITSLSLKTRLGNDIVSATLTVVADKPGVPGSTCWALLHRALVELFGYSFIANANDSDAPDPAATINDQSLHSTSISALVLARQSRFALSTAIQKSSPVSLRSTSPTTP
ncbi:hypothetical protein NMY22_g6266 [Coprinellus aureogranulatus]|nr:hypothetical protein NMY22_g6266 [Coprinellus aureogranulatus]